MDPYENFDNLAMYLIKQELTNTFELQKVSVTIV